MSAEIINLRRARKAKRRRDSENQAAENRAKFGQSKNDQHAIEAEKVGNSLNLDGAKISLSPPDHQQTPSSD
ncbi:MAG: DUF4169 family protein [Hyphomicrobiaceae bacterium]